jgi:hypothetical protein
MVRAGPLAELVPVAVGPGIAAEAAEGDEKRKRSRRQNLELTERHGRLLYFRLVMNGPICGPA